METQSNFIIQREYCNDTFENPCQKKNNACGPPVFFISTIIVLNNTIRDRNFKKQYNLKPGFWSRLYCFFMFLCENCEIVRFLVKKLITMCPNAKIFRLWR